MATNQRLSKNWAPLIVALLIALAMVVGIWRSLNDARDSRSNAPAPSATQTLTPNPPSADQTPDTSSAGVTPGDLERGDGHGHEEDPSAGPPPTNEPDRTGSDHDEDEDVPAAEKPRVIARTSDFWQAFSIRGPKNRDKALAKVAVPYLAKKMSVSATYRIPEVVVERSAIVAGSFSMAVSVSEAQSGEWWYVVFIYDPATETWNAQEYQKASPKMINDAELILNGEEES